MDKTIEDKIKGIIANQLGSNFDRLTPETKLIEDLRISNDEMVELVYTLEDEFNIIMQDIDVEKLETIGELVLYCTAKYEDK